MSAGYAPAIEGRCCICDPSLQINANVCVEHKEAGKALAAQRGIRFVDAADALYWEARDLVESYCLEHLCWHGNCPAVGHLDFSVIHRDAIPPSQLRTLEDLHGLLPTASPSVRKIESTESALAY